MLCCHICWPHFRFSTATQCGSHTHADTRRHTRTHTHAHTHTQTHTHTRTHTHTHTQTHTHRITHTESHTESHADTHADTHTQTHTRRHTRRHCTEIFNKCWFHVGACFYLHVVMTVIHDFHNLFLSDRQTHTVSHTHAHTHTHTHTHTHRVIWAMFILSQASSPIWLMSCCLFDTMVASHTFLRWRRDKSCWAQSVWG